MKDKKIIVDVHVLQTVPPSCINRDDTGSPKTAVYGGVTRARVSSQSWKKAVRSYFRNMYTEEEVGVRTKCVVEMVEKEILKIDESADAYSLAVSALKNAGIKLKGKGKKEEKEEKEEKYLAEALFFMSSSQAKALAELAVTNQEAIKSGKDKALNEKCLGALAGTPSLDIALFGRMVAGELQLNSDAAAMVAHSISTHKIQNEFDYFTAVDELSSDDSSGAGHLGTTEFNSSTLYRYSSVNVGEVNSILDKNSSADIRNFVEAFIMSMPTGKLTTFGNATLPDAVYVTVRSDVAVNMAPAFEMPVLPSEDGGYVNGSKLAFAKYAESVYSNFVGQPDRAWVIGNGLDGLGTQANMKNMLNEMEAYLDSLYTEDNR